ncbi:MAG TPA: PadR family transcriptional regulator [Candidatus Paceibacterota bacterium]|jgi:PadR family transcriptional regulator PadR|nr:PadR family transcriptional regulator [Candidatus Paceibacterota bacterium]
MDTINEKFSSIRKGLLEFVLLKMINAKQMYVADMLQELNQTEFATQEGTLYPLLSRMRRDGYLDYEWQESDSGPPRKYYSLTKKGREQLKEIEEYWKKINTLIKNI